MGRDPFMIQSTKLKRARNDATQTRGLSPSFHPLERITGTHHPFFEFHSYENRSRVSTRDQSVLTYFVYHRWYTELPSAGCCNKKHKNISKQVWNINNYKCNKITNRKSHTQTAINVSKIDRSKSTRQRNHWTSPVHHRSTQRPYSDDKITWKSIFYNNMSRRETISLSRCVSNG